MLSTYFTTVQYKHLNNALYRQQHMERGLFFLVLTAVLLGWFSHTAMSTFEIPTYSSAPERLSPSDHLAENQIFVYNDFAVVRAENLFWARFSNTNSMDPILDETANSLEIKPKKPENIQVGDIISYVFKENYIVHRVVYSGYDDLGWYALVKGDNNPEPDPEKVRFEQIRGVVVGILY